MLFLSRNPLRHFSQKVLSFLVRLTVEALGKVVPIDLVLRDIRVAEGYIEEKLQRTTTHCQLRALASQLEDVVDKPMSRGMLPDAVRVLPFTDLDQRLVLLQSGVLVIVHRSTLQLVPVFPRGFDLASCLMLNHVVDRCAINVSMLYFAQWIGLLWTWRWGLTTTNGIQSSTRPDDQVTGIGNK